MADYGLLQGALEEIGHFNRRLVFLRTSIIVIAICPPIPLQGERQGLF